jgi:hypothetical protein
MQIMNNPHCMNTNTKPPKRLGAHAQSLLNTSMAWMDGYWDEAFGLLWDSDEGPVTMGTGRFHTVRSSLWYAVGLLMRQQPGDVERALIILDKVLDYQFDAPNTPFHGTFFRAPEEPYPPEPPIIWRSYDPNWREFVMSTYAVILLEYEPLLPSPLQSRIDVALRKAVEGAIARGLSPGYTNIALMFAFVLCFAGRRLNEPDWRAQGEAMARQVYALFEPHQTFDEYNSPTYYGIDLYALALWRCYPAVSEILAPMGQVMEAQLWREAALFYHAGLRNFCGPYDRSYGMDTRRYIAAIGLWMALAMGPTQAPLPDLTGPFDHQHDLTLAPMVALLGTEIPQDVQDGLTRWTGARSVHRTISTNPTRIITAYLDDDYMIGAAFTSASQPRSDQLHAATLHWHPAQQAPLCWVRLHYLGKPTDATCNAQHLRIDSTEELLFEVYAPGTDMAHFDQDHWRLPGLSIRVQSNADGVHFEAQAKTLFIRYTRTQGQPIQLAMEIKRTPISDQPKKLFLKT